jgi:hypothetical protein
MLKTHDRRTPRHGRRRSLRAAIGVAALALVATGIAAVSSNSANAALGFEVQTLDGSGNNVANPTRGRSNTNYVRVGPTRYADGRSQPVAGPNTRRISNRIFNDSNQNVFSEGRVTQWGWQWGQFLDHTFGLAQGGNETANIPFNSADPLETFTNTLGSIPFTRDQAAPGTGVSNAREQVNTVSSYIDAWAVYGGTNDRLEWLRNGTLDGNVTNNQATLMLPNNFLPSRAARGNAATAPTMAVDGRLLSHPNDAAVAGDVRANENIGLTATHTLFAREHNRIVAALNANPAANSLTQEEKFQVARRIVIAEQQYITYHEWLPAMGVNLPQYTGYNPNVNAAVSQEFAVAGYRAHSQIHGEFEFETNASRYSQADLDFFAAQGLEVVLDAGIAEIAVPLNSAFFNPTLLTRLQLGPFLKSLTESQYKNDEQIDNQLRSVLFQVPVPGNPGCEQGPDLEPCFNGVVDLGAIDVERGRDHGLGSYNQLRQAYGLPAVTSFTQITGEATQAFPSGSGVDNPNSLDILNLRNIDGNASDGTDEANRAVFETRRSTVAARLAAIYGNNVNNVDAFVGLVAEPHLAGSEFGPLQSAIWTRQFQALRDGDRFFYGNDPGLSLIRSTYGLDYHVSLKDIIAANTDTPATDIPDNVFLVEDDELPATTCTVMMQQTTEWNGGFQYNISITNTGTTTINGWQLRFFLPTGQSIYDRWGSTSTQSGAQVTMTNVSFNASIAPGATVGGIGFNATWDNRTNAAPPRVSVNNRRCAIA